MFTSVPDMAASLPEGGPEGDEEGGCGADHQGHHQAHYWLSYTCLIKGTVAGDF